MTNGEKFCIDFPNMRIDVFTSYVEVMGENYEFNNSYPLDWWNAEYKEPTNDLGVDAISRADAQTKIEMNASRYTIAKERCGMGQVEWSDQLIKVSDAVDIIRALPSVTPIR